MKNKRTNEVRSGYFKLLIFCCSLLFVFAAKAQPQINFSTYIKKLTSPVEIKNAGDGSGRLFIVEQGGLVKIFKNGKTLNRPFLNISALLANVGDEQGLLSIAFDPKYATNRSFFVYYTATNGAITIANYKASSSDADSAVASSGLILLSIPKNAGSVARNGGNLHFGKDSLLYISTGDGGKGSNTYGNPQDGQSLLGKMLRIKVNAATPPYYTIPSGNPYTNDPKVRDEVWAMGLRQPWQFSFDRLTGDLWIGDVGQSSREEINFRTPAQSAGANYGWPCYEADSTYKLKGCGNMSSYVFPIFAYAHNSTDGGHAVVGGYVYRGSLYPALQGYYICGDYAQPNNIWKIKSNGSGGWNVYPQAAAAPVGLVSFGEGEDAELYAVSISGTIYKVQSTGSTPVSEDAVATDIISDKGLKSLIYPTVVNNSTITLELKEAFKEARIIDMSGHEVLRRSLVGQTGSITLMLPQLNVGIYIVQLLGDQRMQQKIYITK